MIVDGLIVLAVLAAAIFVLAKLLRWWWRYLVVNVSAKYMVPTFWASVGVALTLGYLALFPYHLPVRHEINQLCRSEAGVWIYERAPQKVDGFLTNSMMHAPSLLEAGYSYYETPGSLERGEMGKFRRTYLGTNLQGGWQPVDVLTEQPTRYEVGLRRESRSKWVEAYLIEIHDRETGKLMALRREFHVKQYGFSYWERMSQWWVKSMKCALPNEQAKINLIEDVLPPSGPKIKLWDGKQHVIPPKVPKENENANRE